MSTFSDREVQLMACAFQAMKAPPEIDYATMARLAGMTNPGSASNAMRAIRRKLDAHMPSGTESANGASSNPSTPRKPKTPRTAGGRKRSAASMMEELTPTGSFFDRDDELNGDEVRASVESPSKRKRGGGKPARAVRVKEEVFDEGEEEEEERGTHHDDVDGFVEEV